MSIMTKEKRMEHIHGLVEAARQIARERQHQEECNFQIVMDYFRKIAEFQNTRPEDMKKI
jgi:hypothetical protein